MIPSLRYPVLSVLAASCLLGSAASMRADEPPAADSEAHRKSAEELLLTLHLPQSIEGSSKRLYANADQVTDRMEKQPNATPEQLEEAKKLRVELHDMVDKALSWEAIKGDLVQSYADEFTLADLKEIDAFYHTPVGQKFVDKQPALNEKLSKNLQQRSLAIVTQMRQKIQATYAKLHPVASPAGAMVPPPTALAKPLFAPPTTVTTAPVTVTTAPISISTAPVSAPSATPTVPPGR